MRKWGHYEQAEQVFPGSTRARRAPGAEAQWRVSVAEGGCLVHCAEDRLRAGHAAGWVKRSEINSGMRDGGVMSRFQQASGSPGESRRR